MSLDYYIIIVYTNTTMKEIIWAIDILKLLKETVKAVAEELDIKPSLINKAIKIAQKGDWERVAEEYDDLETMVTTVGADKTWNGYIDQID